MVDFLVAINKLARYFGECLLLRPSRVSSPSGSLIAADTCPYNGSRVHPTHCDACVRSHSPHAGLTVFKRVRLNITSLHILRKRRTLYFVYI